MTLAQWFLFFLLVQVVHFLGTWKLYTKAGFKAWQAAVPVYNAVILMKIIKRPWWWTILLFVPIVNLIMFPVVWVETLRSFGKTSYMDTFLGIITLGLYIYYINYTQDVHYRAERDLIPKSTSGEWTSSILFAVVAATIVHTYVMQPFTIPTGSLERTLLIGDFLFVSKFHYGARTPMTTVSFPMVHDTIPLVKTKSYTNWPQLPYFRLPGFEDVELNDIVVFNWPIDTVSKFFVKNGQHYYKPIDKRSNYVKRCVGLPGDSLKIVDGDVYVNNKILELPERAKPQHSYAGHASGGFNAQQIKDDYEITNLRFVQGSTFYSQAIPDKYIDKFKNHPSVVTIKELIDSVDVVDPSIFPGGKYSLGNKDQMKSFWIPQKGATVDITVDNLPMYKRIIEIYEGLDFHIDNTLSTNGNQVLLNGSPLTEYTFKQDYYWMMGDNRHNSEDSRFWGFVPETHIVGKPVFIWLSIDSAEKGLKKIRWERMFTTVSGSGQPVSYLLYTVVGVLVIIVVVKVMKNKKRHEKKK
mgnify:CR=1 FL=1